MMLRKQWDLLTADLLTTSRKSSRSSGGSDADVAAKGAMATEAAGAEAAGAEATAGASEAAKGSTAAVEVSDEASAGMQPVPAFTLLKALYGKRVTRLAAGDGHVRALCEGGAADVLSWGRGAEGQLGHGVR